MIITGTTPNFLEVVFNVGGGDDLSRADSWLIQLKKALAFRLHFFGDYTWLNLFPGFFDKYETTNTLFVMVFSATDIRILSRQM
jgi:ethanolaminephosphotransferase